MTCGRTRRSAPTTSYSYLFDTTDALPLDTIRASLYDDVFTIHIMLNLLYIRVPKVVPPLELFGSNVGKQNFLRWKRNFPREENKISSLGNLFFQGWKLFGNLREQLRLVLQRVLFLKKVHSWEGVTEMVHGLFLLVL